MRRPDCDMPDVPEIVAATEKAHAWLDGAREHPLTHSSLILAGRETDAQDIILRLLRLLDKDYGRLPGEVRSDVL